MEVRNHLCHLVCSVKKKKSGARFSYVASRSMAVILHVLEKETSCNPHPQFENMNSNISKHVHDPILSACRNVHGVGWGGVGERSEMELPQSICLI